MSKLLHAPTNCAYFDRGRDDENYPIGQAMISLRG